MNPETLLGYGVALVAIGVGLIIIAAGIAMLREVL